MNEFVPKKFELFSVLLYRNDFGGIFICKINNAFQTTVAPVAPAAPAAPAAPRKFIKAFHCLQNVKEKSSTQSIYCSKLCHKPFNFNHIRK